MLRKLLLLTCLLATVSPSFAQGKKNRNVPDPVPADPGKPDYKKLGAELPALKIYTREGKYLTDKELVNGANLILMMFNPTCEHCEDMTRTLKDNIGLFKRSNLVLVAGPMMVPYLGYFTNNTKIADVSAIQVGVDSLGFIDKAFRYEALPQINIYNKERKLVKVFTGPVPIDSLKMFIE